MRRPRGVRATSGPPRRHSVILVTGKNEPGNAPHALDAAGRTGQAMPQKPPDGA